jgi:hypothetical protein
MRRSGAVDGAAPLEPLRPARGGHEAALLADISWQAPMALSRSSRVGWCFGLTTAAALALSAMRLLTDEDAATSPLVRVRSTADEPSTSDVARAPASPTRFVPFDASRSHDDGRRIAEVVGPDGRCVPGIPIGIFLESGPADAAERDARPECFALTDDQGRAVLRAKDTASTVTRRRIDFAFPYTGTDASTSVEDATAATLPLPFCGVARLECVDHRGSPAPFPSDVRVGPRHRHYVGDREHRGGESIVRAAGSTSATAPIGVDAEAVAKFGSGYDRDRHEIAVEFIGPRRIGGEVVVRLSLPPPPASVRATLLRPDGVVMALIPMTVTAFDAQGRALGSPRRTTTDSDGVVTTTFDGAEGPGPWGGVITFESAFLNGPPFCARAVVGARPESDVIDVGTLTLKRPAALVTGRIVDRLGEPLSSAALGAVGSSSAPPDGAVSRRSRKLEHDPRLVVVGPRDDGCFSVYGPPECAFVRLEATLPARPAAHGFIACVAGARDVRLVVDGVGGAVEGSIVLGDLEPHFVSVRIDGAGDSRTSRLGRGAAGRFESRELTPGSYAVTVLVDGLDGPFAALTVGSVTIRDAELTRDPRLQDVVLAGRYARSRLEFVGEGGEPMFNVELAAKGRRHSPQKLNWISSEASRHRFERAEVNALTLLAPSFPIEVDAFSTGGAARFRTQSLRIEGDRRVVLAAPLQVRLRIVVPADAEAAGRMLDPILDDGSGAFWTGVGGASEGDLRFSLPAPGDYVVEWRLRAAGPFGNRRRNVKPAIDGVEATTRTTVADVAGEQTIEAKPPEPALRAAKAALESSAGNRPR